ncbi:ABC transporter permease subunit [Vagococcus sp. BWB3-3]|uniref:ABC transporter permease subunit n=1 Tax=Vagococcus allomyrinae TaxID=2794353 RepID=A0A940SVP0_9ENTE|nr:ABC transporter permease subunit [Vagococcus allomyrinae]MBP1040528.1 ABC transporter permease subunit [Vagococcus allomyrinae]
MKRKSGYLLIPLGLVVGLFLVIPLLYMLIASFQLDGSGQWSLANYSQSLTNPYYYQSFVNSGMIAFFSSMFGLVGALIFCQALLALPKKAQERFTLFSNLAANFAGVPLAFGFIIMLGNAGVLKLLFPIFANFDLYSWQGLVVTYVYFQIPLATLLLYPVIKKVKVEWQESAALFGASPFYYWRRVVLPFMAPSLTGTFVILFANGMGTYETAYALVGSNINLVTTRISALVAGDVYAKPNVGSALAVLFALSMIVVISLSQKIMGRVSQEGA